MSALGHQSLINSNRAYWLSSISNDVTHSTITTQEIDANLARFSTVFVSDFLTTSSLNASSFSLKNLDLSEGYISTLRTNNAFTSSLTWASDLSGGSGTVVIQTDPSGVRISGDPIIFTDLVYFTSTITTLPVSTIVDTDIFAQNGYFSTLSSGSISSGALQTSSLLAHQAVMSTLTVSSITTTDISGFEPETWSLYPTLNSSITFQPGNVLSNVGNKLFFAGQEITDASGGGEDWSRFQALQDVSMNNFSLRQLSTLQYQDGASLFSLTGNNLFYNGQPISYGATGNASLWSQFPARTNITAGQSTLTVGNIQNNGSNITNGNTFTNSLGVGGLSLVPIASITSGGDLSCRNIEVGDSVTSLADVNIYGATALPGDSALYVAGGVQFDGGLIHGFSAGLLPVAGINTGRIDMLQAGFNILHPLVGAITTGTAMSLTAGAALSFAAGAYIETNTSTIQCINTTQGNKNTTLQTGFITIDPDVAPTSSIKLFNVLGGGVEIDGGGQGSLQGFSTVQSQFISSLSTNANTSRVNQEFASTIFANFILCTSSVFNNIAVNNIKIADDITGVTNAPMPLQSRLLNFSTVNSFNVSTTDLWVSSINGAAPGGGGGGGSQSNYINLTTSTLNVSTINQIGGTPIKIDGTLEFVSPNSIDRVVNINLDDSIPNLQLNATNITLGALSNTFAGSMSTQRLFTDALGASSITTSSMITEYCQTSTLAGFGGFVIKVGSPLTFIGPDAINNVAVINDTPLQVPTLQIGASTIFLSANNVGTNSLSTIRNQSQQEGVSSLTFSTATCVLSNTAFNFPLVIDHDAAGNLSTSGAAIRIAGHSFQDGAAVHELQMGWRSSDAANFITAVWPGQNLEDLSIEAAPLKVTDGTFSTIFNQSPYALQTTQAVAVGSISTTQLALSTIQMYEESGIAPAGLSSLMHIGYGYNISSSANGFWIENYINTVDNLDFGLLGNGDGGYIKSWQNGRSTYSELFLVANTMTLGVDNSVIIDDNNGNDYTEIGPTFISTQSLTVNTINGYEAQPALTNNLMLSTMNLFAASTTLMYWDSTTTSDNINTSGYDVVVGVNGNYKIGCSFQFLETGAPAEVEFFILKNDSPIVQSGGIQEVTTNQELITYFEGIEKLANGDKIQIGCFTNSSNLFVSTINGNIIQSPAAILTMYKLDM